MNTEKDYPVSPLTRVIQLVTAISGSILIIQNNLSGNSGGVILTWFLWFFLLVFLVGALENFFTKKFKLFRDVISTIFAFALAIFLIFSFFVAIWPDIDWDFYHRFHGGILGMQTPQCSCPVDDEITQLAINLHKLQDRNSPTELAKLYDFPLERYYNFSSDNITLDREWFLEHRRNYSVGNLYSSRSGLGVNRGSTDCPEI